MINKIFGEGLILYKNRGVSGENMLENEVVVPRLKNDVKIDYIVSDSTNKRYILSTPVKKYRISEIYYRIIALIDGKRTYNEISSELEDRISPQEIKNIYENEFEKLGIIENSIYTEEKKKSFLIWKKEIIKDGTLNNFKQIDILFKRNACLGVILLGFMINGFGIIKFYTKDFHMSFKIIFDNPSSIVVPLILSYISILVHELGHYLCCKHFKGNPGSIGIGFYFTAPVLFTNLDDVWRLKKSERILVNLSGIYLQNVYLFLISLIAVVFNIKELFIVSILFSVISLLNLIPFIKLDGYWVLVDYFEIPNLLKYTCNLLLFKLRIKKNYNFTEINLSKGNKKLFDIYIYLLCVFIILFTVGLIKSFGESIYIIYYNFKNLYNIKYNDIITILKAIVLGVLSVKIFSVLLDSIKD